MSLSESIREVSIDRERGSRLNSGALCGRSRTREKSKKSRKGGV